MPISLILLTISAVFFAIQLCSPQKPVTFGWLALGLLIDIGLILLLLSRMTPQL